MKRAIVSFASGTKHTELLSISIPSFYRHSEKFNYDLIIPSHNKIKEICNLFNWDLSREPSWLKIPILKYLLEIENYDLVCWLDSDVVIAKHSEDICKTFCESPCIQALTFHQIAGIPFSVPNCGVWFLKKDCVSLLNEVWNNEDSIDRLWWEQGSLINLMFKNQDIFHKTHELDYLYNVHIHDLRFTQNSEKDGIILHATMHGDDMANKMKFWIDSQQS
jgi:hypothetical protein